MRARAAAIAAGVALLAGGGTAAASAATAAHENLVPSHRYVWCWYGKNWAEIVPDGTLTGVPQGWCAIWYQTPYYRGVFTVVAPDGARAVYYP